MSLYKKANRRRGRHVFSRPQPSVGINPWTDDPVYQSTDKDYENTVEKRVSVSFGEKLPTLMGKN